MISGSGSYQLTKVGHPSLFYIDMSAAAAAALLMKKAETSVGRPTSVADMTNALIELIGGEWGWWWAC